MKQYLIFLLLCICSFGANAQLCQPASQCSDAPLFCGFALENDLFNNLGDGNTSTVYPQCNNNFFPHNSSWFRIIPCSTDLTLVINTWSTINGDGLQVALYTACELDSTVVCNAGMNGGAFQPLVLSTTVEPGKNYYLQVDGFNGDLCDFTIDVLSGISTEPPPPPIDPVPGIISSSPGSGSALCGAGVFTFEVSWPGCDNFEAPQLPCYQVPEDCQGIEWTFPPGTVVLGNDPYANPITVLFNQPGNFIIRAKPRDCACPDDLCPSCGQICCPAQEALKPVTILPPVTTVLPPISLCAAQWPPDCAFLPWGNLTPTTAQCQASVNYSNCSQVLQPYNLLPSDTTDLGVVAICEGDSVVVCDTFFQQIGTHYYACTCDSVVKVQIIKDLSCYNECGQAYNTPAPPGIHYPNAPYLCGNYLDGYCSSNQNPNQPFGDTTFNNAAFLRFAGCNEDGIVELGISVNDCYNASGLSVSVVDTFYNLIHSDFVNNGDSLAIQFFVIPNAPYYLQFYNNNTNGVCGFQISVISGIGTADPGTASCDCTPGNIAGPDELCPADIAEYTIQPGSCAITFAPGDAGNGYFCCPDGINSDTDTLSIVWHIPDFMNFLSDSVNVTTIQVQVDSSYLGQSIDQSDSIWVSYEYLGQNPWLTDSLTYCGCQVNCVSTVNAKVVHIQHVVTMEYCLLTCTNPVCNIGGIPYSTPGNFTSGTNCETHIVTIDADWVQPSLFVIPPPILCDGMAAPIVAQTDPQSIISWEGPGVSGTVGSVVIASIPGTYTATATNLSNGCTASQSVEVTITAPVLANINGPTELCEGATGVLTAAGSSSGPNYTYTWSTGDLGNSTTISPVQTSVYTLSVTENNSGCQAIVSTTVAVTPLQVQNLGVIGQISCNTPCITFQGNTYCAGGNYSDTSNCVVQHFTIESLKDIVQLGVVDTITCTMPCAVFLGQNYCQPGDYTTEDSCFLYLFSISVDSALQVVDLGEIGQISCNTPCITFQGNTYCNTGNFTDTLNCTIQQFSIGFEKDTVQLGVLDTLTCKDSCTVYMGTTYCQAGSYSVTDSCYIYIFSVDADFSSPTINGLTHECHPSNTTYTVGFSIAGTPPYFVNAAPVSGNYYTSAPIPNGDTYAFIVEQASNGCTQLVSGDFNCVLACGIQAGILSNMPIQTCENEAAQVTLLTPAVTGTGDTSVFVLHTSGTGSLGTVLGYSPDGQFSLQSGMQLGTTYYISSLAGPKGTSDPVDLSDVCTKISTGQPITFYPLPTWDSLTVLSPTCSDAQDGLIEIVGLQANEPWAASLNGSTATSNLTFEQLSAGTYSLLLTDGIGCSSTATATLEAPEAVWVNVTPDQAAVIGATVNLTAQTNASNVLWTNLSTNEQRQGTTWAVQVMDGTNTYLCTATDDNGCTATATVTLRAAAEGIYAPNVVDLSANEPQNRKFMLYAAPGYAQEITELAIYDRWGELVYHGTNLAPGDTDSGWGGTWNGKQARPAVYLFTAKVLLRNGTTKALKGDITLLR